MKETTLEGMGALTAHNVQCPSCKQSFPVKFADFEGSPYQPIACDQCPNLLALSEVDPVVLYLYAKFPDQEAEVQATMARALAPCSCGGSFRIFDDRRSCPLCKASLKEIQLSGQVEGIKPESKALITKMITPENDMWKNLEFLREEVEVRARDYETNPSSGASLGDTGWLAKEIYDLHFRKISFKEFEEITPARRDLFFFNKRLYHDHGGARGSWWRFWSREVLYPERCGRVFDIDRKELKCASCRKTFTARIR